MFVKILRNTVAAGIDVKAGDELELPDSEAKTIILLGKAEAIEGKASAGKSEAKPATKNVEENQSGEDQEDGFEPDPDLGKPAKNSGKKGK